MESQKLAGAVRAAVYAADGLRHRIVEVVRWRRHRRLPHFLALLPVVLASALKEFEASNSAAHLKKHNFDGEGRGLL